MERERKLGWIAIAIGTVALLVALSSQFGLWRMQHSMMGMGGGRMGSAYGQGMQQNGQNGPRGWNNQQNQQGQQAQPSQQNQQGGRGWRGQQDQGQFQQQGQGPRGGGFFGRGPFGGVGLFKLGMLAALLKLGLLALAIFLLVKWLNKRRQPATPVAPVAHAPAAPPSEEPPYTNETRNL